MLLIWDSSISQPAIVVVSFVVVVVIVAAIVVRVSVFGILITDSATWTHFEL